MEASGGGRPAQVSRSGWNAEQRYTATGTHMTPPTRPNLVQPPPPRMLRCTALSPACLLFKPCRATPRHAMPLLRPACTELWHPHLACVHFRACDYAAGERDIPWYPPRYNVLDYGAKGDGQTGESLVLCRLFFQLKTASGHW